MYMIDTDSSTSTSYSLLEALLCTVFSIPGVDLDPGFCVRPRALMTSTSNWPFLSTIPIWISPEREKKKPTF